MARHHHAEFEQQKLSHCPRCPAPVQLSAHSKSTTVQGVPKKVSFGGKAAIAAFRLIRGAGVGGVLENSGYLLHHGR